MLHRMRKDCETAPGERDRDKLGLLAEDSWVAGRGQSAQVCKGPDQRLDTEADVEQRKVQGACWWGHLPKLRALVSKRELGGPPL